MVIVYIDVLFILNLIVNYFILLGVSRLLHRTDKRARLFAGASFGAVYASLIFFPQLGFIYTAALKIIFSAVIVIISFKSASIGSFIKLLITFYITSTLFGGIIFAVEYFLSPPGLDVRNGVMYYDISPLVLIISSAGCYILIKLFSRYLHRNVHTSDIYSVEIEVDGRSVKIPALLDNGNELRDSISGCPVIIAEYHHVERLIPQQLRTVFKNCRVGNTDIFKMSDWKKRIRIIPYGSVGNVGGILPAFRPDRLTVDSAGVDTNEVLVAVTNNRLSDDGNYFLLLNPHLFKGNNTIKHDTRTI